MNSDKGQKTTYNLSNKTYKDRGKAEMKTQIS